MKCRSYSFYLQKAIVDIGSDVSFQKTQKKLGEHYQIYVSVSAIQRIVEKHAKNISKFIENENFEEGTAQQIIVEMDGSMIPIVDTKIPKEGKADKRKGRSVRWQEVRLCMARGSKQLKPVFYATMSNVERAGDLLYRAGLRVGFGKKTKVHGVGEGTRWIED